MNEYNIDADKLVFKEFIIMPSPILEFQVNFSYGASMLDDTGKLRV